MLRKLSKREILEKTKRHATRLKEELRKSIVTAIVAAFGLVIALVWKDVITGFIDQIVSLSPLHGALIKALIVTFVCVIGMILITWILSPKPPVEQKKEEDKDED